MGDEREVLASLVCVSLASVEMKEMNGFVIISCLMTANGDGTLLPRRVNGE